MTILWSILYGLVLALLLIVLGVHPQSSRHSRFELQRRAKQGDKDAAHLLKRRGLLHDLFSLQRVIAAMLIVTLSVLGVQLFHWALGFLISLIIALESGAVARISVIQRLSQSLYERVEGKLLAFIERHPRVFRMIRSVAPIPNDAFDIESKEELLAMVEQSGDALQPDDKRLIVNGLTFDTRPVKTVMTPRSIIDAVPEDEVLGPLVLDALHKTGHSRFPVIDGDIDHVVGMLYMQDFLDISRKTAGNTARQAMTKKVYYIHEDHSLQQALTAFIKTRHHLFIVVNEFRETVGIVSLEDVIEALLGRKIVDEFDAHEDLRKVAESNPRRNNKSRAAQDIA
ncbi:MAG: CBS domain-containing protein [Candidatus Saccharibacteria bacterium]|nr:CBS domain-containing protein [Candidatus Saccharibacteria bacterium]